MYIYEDHMGGLYTADHMLNYEERYCEQCRDADWFIGYATTRAKAWDVLKANTSIDGHYGWDLNYVQSFINANWSE